MLYIVALSVLVRAAATAWSVLLWRRLRDRRLAWLTAALAFLTIRQLATLLELTSEPGFRLLVLDAELVSVGTTVLCLLAVYGLGRMILERDNAAEELRQSKALQQAMLRAIPDLMFRMAADGTYLDYQAQDDSRLLLPPEQFLGRRAAEILPPSMAADTQRAIDAALATGQPQTHEYRSPRDPSRAWEVRTVASAPGEVLAMVRDVTEWRRTEAFLRESESRFRTLADSAPVFIWMTDEHNNSTYYNRSWLEYTGRPLETELADGWSKNLHPDERDRCLARYLQAFQARVPFSMEYRIRRADGSYGWLLERGVPRFTPDGHFQGFIGSATEITAQKLAEEALAEREGRLRTIIQSEPECVALVDHRGRVLEINPAGLAMIGAGSAGEVLSRSILLRVPREYRADLRALISSVFRGESGSLVFEITGLKGGRRWLDTHAVPLRSASGEISAVLGITRDITERKRAEDALRQSEEFNRRLVETMPAGLVEVAADGRITRANVQAQKILGLTIDELTGRVVADFRTQTIREDGSPFPVEEYPVTRCLATGKPQPATTIGVRRPDGKTSWGLFIASPLRDAGDKVTGAVVTFLDITAIKEGEEAHRQTSTTLRSIIRTSPLAIISIDPRGGVLDWNPAAERIFGWSAGEIVGRPLPIVPQSERAVFESMISEDGAGVARPRLETKRMRRDGTLVDVELWTSPQLDSSGRVVAIIGILADITERKRLQDELLRSEERYRRLVDSAPIGLIVNQNGVYVYANREALQIFGADDPSEILGRPVFEMVDPKYHDAIRERMRRIQRTGQAVPPMHQRFLRLDGTTVDVEVASTPTTFNGSPAIQVVVRDITEHVRSQEERRAAEQRDSLLIEQTPLAVIVCDTERRVLEWNPAAERIFGYSVEEAIGRPLEFIVPERSRATLDRIWADLAAGRGGTRSTNENITKDGKPILCEWYNSPLVGADGRIIGVASLCQDVTETKRLEEELRRSQKMEAIGQLASGVAHDFGNLLTAIFGFTSLARRTLSPNHPATRSLDRVDEAAKHASGVTKALLTFSRGGTSEKKSIPLAAVVDDAVRLLRRTLPSNIQIHAGLGAGQHVYVRADATQLQQVVLNLAINARDAMRSGGRLSITVDQTDPAPESNGHGNGKQDGRPRSAARLTVTDTGTGMPPEVLGRIFEPFFTTKPPGEGTGLGLAIIHGIVKDHGGSIQVRSEVGKGSSFTVTLPTAAPELEPAPVDRPALIPAGRGELILLADSHGYIRELITSMLVSLGYRVVQASDGPGFLDSYARNRGQVRLLILDSQMPGRAGADCLAEIRASGDGVRAVLLTEEINADSLPPDPRTRILPKPFQMNELADAVSAALR